MAAPVLKTWSQTFKTDALGQIFLSGITDVREYAAVNLEIIQHPTNVRNLQVSVMMGKITGWTLSQELERFPLDSTGKIHTYAVVGPELSVVLVGGPPNTDVALQAWVFIR
jgi:hypothetical protein